MAEEGTDKSSPPPVPPQSEEKAIDLSEGRRGVVVLPTDAVGPADLQGVIDQVSNDGPVQAAPAEPAAGDSGATGAED
jgi:hypothetical protein